MQLSDQELARRENLEEARALGLNPYPAEAFPVSHLATEVLNYERKYTNSRNKPGER